MKQAKKKTEVTQMEPIKTGKTISLQKYKDQNGTEIEVTKALLAMILNFRPDKDKYPEWGMNMEEILERREIRKNMDGLHPESTVVEITNEQAKILLAMFKIIDWRIEDDFLIDLYNSLK